MAERANQRIRRALKLKGMCIWELAEKLEISETHLGRLMRSELPDDEQNQIISIINGADISFEHIPLNRRKRHYRETMERRNSVTTYLDSELLDKMNACIEGTNVSRAKFMRDALKWYLDVIIK
jgi:hypothetical protein